MKRYLRLPNEFSRSRNHGGARCDAKLHEHAPDVRAYRPGANVEHRGDHLIGVSLRDEAHDLDLARAKPMGIARCRWHSDQEIAAAIEIDVHKHPLRLLL